MNDTGGETAQGWAEFTELGLGETPARQLWRNLMTAYTSRFPGRGTLIEETLMEGRAEGLVAGRAESRAEDILRILDRRGIEVPEAVRERVTACADLDILGTWFDRALTVVSAEELFAEA